LKEKIMTNNDAIELNIDNGIATITLNEPSKLNALSSRLIDAMMAATAQLREDKSIRVLRITGKGKAFSAGADLSGMNATATHVGNQTRGEWTDDQMRTRHNKMVADIRSLPFPILTILNGPVAGGSVGVALAADIVIAARSAYVYLPFMSALGIAPDMGSSWFLPRLIGTGRSMAMTLLGNRVSAEQAAAWGMIWSCVDDSELAAEAERITARLANLPAHAALETRAIFDASLHNNLQQQLDYERARQHELIDKEEFVEGVNAFMEKRPPVFPR
jgi:2-(1,2-epoxy-1,2-dihydrophenyl)acetyl-CoA isomerase